jgi:hypothetical protein
MVVGTVMASRASAAAGSRAAAAGAQGAGAERLAREVNARRRERQANDILRRGGDEADIILAQALEVRSAQVANFASAGVIISSGSARLMQEDTMRLAQADAITQIFSAIEEAEEVKSAGQFEELASISRERAVLSRSRSDVAGFKAQGRAQLIGGISSAAGSLSQANFTSGSRAPTNTGGGRGIDVLGHT